MFGESHPKPHIILIIIVIPGDLEFSSVRSSDIEGQANSEDAPKSNIHAFLSVSRSYETV